MKTFFGLAVDILQYVSDQRDFQFKYSAPGIITKYESPVRGMQRRGRRTGLSELPQ